MQVEIEQKGMWAMKKLKLDWAEVAEQRLNGLNEPDDFRLRSFESSIIYKDQMKRYHNQRIENREFVVGDFMFLFNSRQHLFPSKLKSKWTGPFLITTVFPHVEVKLDNKKNAKFTLNEQRIKIYLG